MKSKTGFFLTLLILLSIFYSACEEALVRSISDEKVVLLAPGDKVVTTAPIDFYWERISGAEQYQLQIMSPTFDTIELFVADTLVNKNVLKLSLQPGKYEWRVRAINSGNLSLFSSSRKFTVQL